jgi:tetratricopeptide (TPR) repeat protein
MMQRTFVALVCAVMIRPASAQTPRLPAGVTSDIRYEQCLARAARQPADAFEDALAWMALGGAEPARHCAAVALLYNGQPEAAALRLEQLALNMRGFAPSMRAELVAQAGRAWLEGGNPSRAAAVLSAAIELTPDNAELWIDRAEAYAAAAKYWEAIDDLNRAIELDRRRADAYAFRAAAYRLVNSFDLALEDANRAISANPRLPEAWLERGILHWQKADRASARRDFVQVLVLDANGPAGDAARANIERMELELDDEPTLPPPRRKR